MDCVRFVRDQSGGVLVETTVMLTIILLVVIGSIDFLFAFYQWNAATKAVEIGARIAAVSDPVAIGLDRLSAAVMSATLNPEDPMPYFSVTCVGANATCTCTGACSGMGGYSDSAMNNIVFGRGNSACTAARSSYYIGMCNIFDRIGVTNVIVVYTQTGLGYVGRPGGPVPTITVALQNLPFQFFFLGALIGLNNVEIPAMTTTITGEDLSSSAPS
jgi:Flp pilus assembly protein TadG